MKYAFIFFSLLYAGFPAFSSEFNPEPAVKDGIPAGSEFYLVTSTDRDFMGKLENVSDIAYDQGRTRLIRLKIPYEDLSPELKAGLKRTERGEAHNYRVSLKTGELPKPEVQRLVSGVSAESIMKYAGKLVYAGKRSSSQLDVKKGSGNKLAMDAVEEAFKSLGYAVEKNCYRDRKCDKECNISGLKSSGSPEAGIILIIAHLDSVGHENAGADDNASGVGGLLEMARVLAGFKSDHELLFVASNGEETGIAGGYAYVKKLKASGTLGRVKYVINMDMISWNKDGIVELETDKEFLEHADWVGVQAYLYTKLKPYVASPAWGSDHVPFLEEGIPTYLSIEHWETHSPCYHQTCDQMEGLAWDYAAEIVKLNLAVIAGKTKLEI